MGRTKASLPRLHRVAGKDGNSIGSWYINTRDDSGRSRRLTLWTRDVEKAKLRRHEFITTGRREFPDDDDPIDGVAVTTVAAPAPAPAPADAPPVIPIVPASVARQLGPVETPIILPPEPAPISETPTPSAPPEPTIAVESDTAGDWTKDAARAAGADVVDAEPIESPRAASPEPAPAAKDDGKVRIKDLAALGPVFVTASRIAVQLQVAFHVLIARYLFKTELDPIRDEVPKDIAGFMKAQGEPWPATDPREPGRQMWEQFGRRICPDDMVLPDWCLAPALVAIGTLPVQIAGRKPIVKPAGHVPVVPSKPVEVAPAPANGAAAKPDLPPPDPARTRHIPVMPDIE